MLEILTFQWELRVYHCEGISPLKTCGFCLGNSPQQRVLTELGKIVYIEVIAKQNGSTVYVLWMFYLSYVPVLFQMFIFTLAVLISCFPCLVMLKAPCREPEWQRGLCTGCSVAPAPDRGH